MPEVRLDIDDTIALPVEIMPFGWETTRARVEALGYDAQPYVIEALREGWNEVLAHLRPVTADG